jgi:hypothetical protein
MIVIIRRADYSISRRFLTVVFGAPAMIMPDKLHLDMTIGTLADHGKKTADRAQAHQYNQPYCHFSIGHKKDNCTLLSNYFQLTIFTSIRSSGSSKQENMHIGKKRAFLSLKIRLYQSSIIHTGFPGGLDQPFSALFWRYYFGTMQSR